jgi:tetraacyldisaccharide 4'-kinase
MLKRTTALPIAFIYFLYHAALFLSTPLVGLYLLFRVLRQRRYARHLGERWGRLPAAITLKPTHPGTIWLHAVSVGELLSATQLLKALRAEYPQAALYLSTTTLSGRAICEERLAPLVDGFFYTPLDYRFAIRAVLRRLQPQLVVILETEIWPNLYREVKRSGARLAIVNGRISDKAWPSYLRFRPLFAAALQFADRVWVQSERDRARYAALGVERFGAPGNLKFDFDPASKPVAPEIAKFFRQHEGAEVVMAASTVPATAPGDVDEDALMLSVFAALRDQHPRLLFVHVPRKPERFASVAAQWRAAGVPVARRSQLPAENITLPGVLVLDSMGELASLFPYAHVVFVGGSLCRWGGHNFLEPAFSAKPILVGPHNQNFQSIFDEFAAAGALDVVPDAGHLPDAIARRLESPGPIGARARELAEAKRGFTRRVAGELASLASAAIPRPIPSVGHEFCARPLAALWTWFAARRAATQQLQKVQPPPSTRLPHPVISIGNVTVGGTGKTPFTNWLAERLHQRGLRPAILTRGYGRQSPEKEILVEPGADAPVEFTGDEPQIFIRRRAAALGIGADRHSTGLQLAARADVYLLDDGFQYSGVARDLDLVLIDTLDPFGGFACPPLGRLREPLSGLARADAFLLTRLQPGRRTDGIEQRLRQHQPHAPIFRSRSVLKAWRGGEPCARIGAFCGLGNPQAFWNTLRGEGRELAFQWAFPDHHRYTYQEVQRLAKLARRAGVDCLVTTEKDAVNLPYDAGCVLGPIRLVWAEIDIELLDEDEFWMWFHQRLPQFAPAAAR